MHPASCNDGQHLVHVLRQELVSRLSRSQTLSWNRKGPAVLMMYDSIVAIVGCTCLHTQAGLIVNVIMEMNAYQDIKWISLIQAKSL